MFVDVSDVARKSPEQGTAWQANSTTEIMPKVRGDLLWHQRKPDEYGYAEPFIRTTAGLLPPLPERMQKWANETEKEQLERRGYMVAPYVDL